MSYVRTASFSSSSNRRAISPIVWVVEGTLEYLKDRSFSFRAIFPIAYNSAGVAIHR
ncbi:hypothetical protein DSO57_1010846 [Entomophthora muscae]|uniref:Uncharacterized protein n=1 Tax=Entomophthora muscae TaxID=34485 RepID=A0ACC2RXC8_9FUNG|nr:hypothetical protein DSO57_1010846 [Entomophthora muscae]